MINSLFQQNNAVYIVPVSLSLNSCTVGSLCSFRVSSKRSTMSLSFFLEWNISRIRVPLVSKSPMKTTRISPTSRNHVPERTMWARVLLKSSDTRQNTAATVLAVASVYCRLLHASRNGGRARRATHVVVAWRSFLDYRVPWSLTCCDTDIFMRINN